jgi:hypothetical protein
LWFRVRVIRRPRGATSVVDDAEDFDEVEQSFGFVRWRRRVAK